MAPCIMMNIVANNTDRLRSKLYRLLMITIDSAMATESINDRVRDRSDVVVKKSVGKATPFPTMSKVT